MSFYFPIFDALVEFFDNFQPKGYVGMAKTEKAKKTISVKNKAVSPSSRSSAARASAPVAKKSTSRAAAKAAAAPASVKSSAKSSAKPVGQSAAKSPAKSTVKPAAKTASVKSAAKATPKATVKAVPKATIKAAPQKSAAKTPVKAVAKNLKPGAKGSSKPAPKAAVKSVIKAAPKAAPVKTTAKTAVKAVVKNVPKAALKAAPKAAPTTQDKAPRKISHMAQDVKPSQAKPQGGKAPIMVKAPLNQNMPQITRATPTVALAPHKVTATQSSSSLVKPAYRPIQVINKPLTPAQPNRAMAPMQKPAEKAEFKKGDYVCYPAHGVGEIEAVETQTIGGMEIKLYAIAFEKDRMRLKVPVARAHASGLRKLSSAGRIEDAMKTLQGRAQVRRAMWSRRAQEYETKINSGDPVSIAEVLRDLKRSNDDNDQSYSERQIYQSALERLAREVAAVEKITEIEASERLETMIRGRKARAAAQAEGEADPAALNEEAA